MLRQGGGRQGGIGLDGVARARLVLLSVSWCWEDGLSMVKKGCAEGVSWLVTQESFDLPSLCTVLALVMPPFSRYPCDVDGMSHMP